MTEELVDAFRQWLSSLPKDSSGRSDSVSQSFALLTAGYQQSLSSIWEGACCEALGADPVGIPHLPFISICAHDLLPFFGEVSLAYVPSESIISLGRLPKLITYYSRRLQLQEHLTHELAQGLFEGLSARAVLVELKAEHACLRLRGEESVLFTQAHVGEVADEQRLSQLLRMAKGC